MQTLLWYRFQTIWKQMKVVLICMGVIAGAVLLFALIGGAAAWEAGSFFFDFFVAFLSIYASMLPIFVLQVEDTDLLLILPLTRKQVALGNYVLTWVCAAIMGGYAFLLAIALQGIWGIVAVAMGIVLLVNTIYLPLFVYFGSQKALIFVLLLMVSGEIGFSSISDQTNGFPFDGGFTMVWIVGILAGLLLLHGGSLLLTLHKYQTKDF
ncbi:MAG: ABC-2 transporter permease [Ruminococcus sp.]